MSVRLSVCPSGLGRTRFSRPLIKIEVRFLRTSLLMDVFIFVVYLCIVYVCTISIYFNPNKSLPDLCLFMTDVLIQWTLTVRVRRIRINNFCDAVCRLKSITSKTVRNSKESNKYKTVSTHPKIRNLSTKQKITLTLMTEIKRKLKNITK